MNSKKEYVISEETINSILGLLDNLEIAKGLGNATTLINISNVLRNQIAPLVLDTSDNTDNTEKE